VELSESNVVAIYTAIVSMFVVGGMVGAMGGGYVADKMGRKRGLILSQVSFLGSFIFLPVTTIESTVAESLDI
jgi:MFS family permease